VSFDGADGSGGAGGAACDLGTTRGSVSSIVLPYRRIRPPPVDMLEGPIVGAKHAHIR
jgi:hypothetical protein